MAYCNDAGLIGATIDIIGPHREPPIITFDLTQFGHGIKDVHCPELWGNMLLILSRFGEDRISILVEFGYIKVKS